MPTTAVRSHGIEVEVGLVRDGIGLKARWDSLPKADDSISESIETSDNKAVGEVLFRQSEVPDIPLKVGTTLKIVSLLTQETKDFRVGVIESCVKVDKASNVVVEEKLMGRESGVVSHGERP